MMDDKRFDEVLRRVAGNHAHDSFADLRICWENGQQRVAFCSKKVDKSLRPAIAHHFEFHHVEFGECRRMLASPAHFHERIAI